METGVEVNMLYYIVWLDYSRTCKKQGSKWVRMFCRRGTASIKVLR